MNHLSLKTETAELRNGQYNMDSKRLKQEKHLAASSENLVAATNIQFMATVNRNKNRNIYDLSSQTRRFITLAYKHEDL